MKRIFTRHLFKILHLAMLVLAGVCSATHARASDPQTLEKRISIVLENVPFETALHEIALAAKVKFAYSPLQMQNEGMVSIIAQQKTLREILDELLVPRQINYKVHEKEATIALRKASSDKGVGTVAPEQPQPAWPAQHITGTVTDEASQQPMAGVNVIVRGTTNGTSTDAGGHFAINADHGDVLVFSFIGYATVSIPVNGQTVIDVSLKEDVSSLKEVTINAGYYTTSKVSQTGNIGKIEAAEIRRQPVSNPLAAMQARVPGLEVIQETGVPGGNFKVRIRGQNSIANGNDPLYIIDGVPFTSTSMASSAAAFTILFHGSSPLNGINPADIESIEVLKDADATAIYGSRGANGVILITTKKGRSGHPRVDVNLYTGWGNPASKMELMKTGQYLAMRREALANAGLPINASTAPDLAVWDTTRYTDWQRELIGNTANVTDAQVSLSGGDDLTQFMASLGYRRETTVFPRDARDQRIAAHISLNNKSKNEKLTTALSVKYSVNASDLIKRDLTDLAMTLAPNAPPLYNEAGDLNWGTDTSSDAWVYPYLLHPLSFLKTDYDSKTKNMLANATVSYALWKNVFAKVNLGYSDVSANTVMTTPISSLAPQVAAFEPNRSVFSSSTFSNWTAEPQLNWKPKLGNSQFDVLVGLSFLEQVEDGLTQYAAGFADEALMKNLGAAASISTASNYYSQYRYAAFFGRINYALRERYFINITGRRDGSSRFGPEKQFANFGAAGVAWVFSEEEAIRTSWSFLSFGKLRASYGITGNDQLGNYQYLDTYRTSGTYQNASALTPVRLANDEYAWETNKKLEGGIELGFIKNRIATTFSIYRNESTDQLVGFSLPPTAGFTSVQGNLPAVIRNTGIEIELNTRNIEKAGWTWTTSFNISFPKNKLVSFPNLEASPSYANELTVGESLSTIKRYNALGVDPQTGLYTFTDVNEDGYINALDRQTPVFVGQKFYGGLSNTLQYRSFQLDFLFQFSKQTKSNFLNSYSGSPGNGFSNQPAWVRDRWQQVGDEATYQLFSQSNNVQQAYDLNRSSTAGVSDGAYIRLKNVSLVYQLPAAWTGKLALTQARFFVQGQNLLTITGYKGLDPESTGFVLPPLRVFTIGLTVTL